MDQTKNIKIPVWIYKLGSEEAIHNYMENLKKKQQQYMINKHKTEPDTMKAYRDANKEKIAEQKKAYRAKIKKYKFTQEDAFEMNDLGDDL